MVTAIDELDSRAPGQIAHRRRDQDLAGGGGHRNALADVKGDSPQVAVSALHLTRMDADSEFDLQRADRVAHGTRVTD